MNIADRRNREGRRASGVGMHLAVCPVMPAGETTDSRSPRGVPSPFAPPHTPIPKPSNTSRIGRGGGGCKPEYGTLGRGTRGGHWSAGAKGLGARRRTDDGGRTMGGTRHWRGAAEYAVMDGEEGKRTKGERIIARCSGEQGTRTNLGEGGKEGTKIISDGKHRNFKNRDRV